MLISRESEWGQKNAYDEWEGRKVGGLNKLANSPRTVDCNVAFFHLARG